MKSILLMGIIVWLTMCFLRRDGCFLIIWPTSAVKPQEFVQRPEKVVINGLERKGIVFPNQVRGHWNAAAPLQLVVSDMTTLKVGTTYWEWTILLDTFNNEILAHSVTSQRGSNKPYYHCLEQLKKRMDKREEQTSQVVFHTDQGAVYSSRAFC